MTSWSIGRSPSHAPSLHVGAFGKTPSAADFLYFGPIDSGTQAFRAWLEEGVSWAAARQPNLWQVASEDRRVFGFLFRAPSGNVLVGAVRPSTDAVGRNFPISAYVELPDVGLSDKPQVLPLALGDLWQHAADAILTDNVLAAVSDLEAALVSGSLAPLSTLTDDARQYADWARATHLSLALEAVFGSNARACAIQAVHTIHEAILPFRGREQPKTPLSVRVPLGGSGAGAAAFWVDVVRHTAGWKNTVPSFFWSFQDGRGEAIVQLGDVPASSLSALWLADPNSEHMCDLTHLVPSDGTRFLPLLPPAVAAALTREDARVIDLLNAF